MLTYLKSILAILALSTLLLVSMASAQTPTPEWVNFYSSNSTLGGAPVPIGAVVEAYDPSGVLCGRYVVTVAGSYGFLACYLDDINTPEDEGIEPGDLITFKINGLTAGKFRLPTSIQNGDRFEMNLSTVAGPQPVPIPEPLSITLVGLGLAGLAGYAHRQRNKAKDRPAA